MTVQELIDVLSNLEDKGADVMICFDSHNVIDDITEVKIEKNNTVLFLGTA